MKSNLISSKYEHFKETIYITLSSYYNYLNSNIAVQREKGDRILNIDVLDCTECVNGIEISIPNAFAIYESNIDQIIISNDLIERIENVVFNTIEDNNKATVLIDTALLFCAFHELGHLLIGHCQLIKSQSLNALYSPIIPSDELYDVYHLLEIDADSFASQRIVEKICANILDKNYKDILGYNNQYCFINDVVCGINIFFSIIGYLEMDYLQRIDPNEYCRAMNIEKNLVHILHPWLEIMLP